MITYQLHICDGQDWSSDTIIYAANPNEMELCLKNLGFVVDEFGNYELNKGEVTYWIESYTATHVAYLKEKL